MTTSRNVTLGLGALALAGAIGPFQLLVYGSPDSAPLGVLLTTAALGVITIAGVVAAWRGSRAGLVVAIVARLVDTALGLPAFVMDAPGWIRALVAVMAVLTIVGIALAAPALRRRMMAGAGS